MFDADFQNACVVLPDAADPADVAVRDGKIAAILPAGSGAAASVVMMIPPFIIFIILQSRIIETMAFSGIKG